MTIGEFIKNRRESLGLTMREVSEAVGVSEATVCRWESGSIGSMRQSRIAALAAVLRVPPEQIVMADRVTDADNKGGAELLADIIKRYREDNDLSQRQFAARCGLSNAYISKIEAGAGQIGAPYKLETLIAIANGMKMEPEELLARAYDIQFTAPPSMTDLDRKRQRLVESVKDMTDDQVDLLQQLVDQILRQR